MPTSKILSNGLGQRLKGSQFVVVSNREPFIDRWEDGKVVSVQPACGLTSALDPVLRATHGLWVAHGSGEADRCAVDSRNRVAVPPGDPSYTLKRVWLTGEQKRLYLDGMSNQGLWPLCHLAYQKPVFEESHWRAYRRVNRLFADAIAEEIGRERAFIFIQDYHFALLARMIKERCPSATTAQFWHIPWPNPEVFGIFPWKQELLESMLDNDLLGFHLPDHCLNFVQTAEKYLGARGEADGRAFSVAYQGISTKAGAFPISVDFEGIRETAESAEVAAAMERLRERFKLTPDLLLAAGVERLDYTKGIPERFRAIERLLADYPWYRGRFTLIQVAVPTRMQIPEYQRTEAEIDSLAGEINRKYGNAGWQPIFLLKEYLPPAAVYALYRLARVCIVSPLQDGMNLVAKEFVSARADEGGVLLLSMFAGAARQMRDALLINPYDVHAFAEAIKHAMELHPDEARMRMRRLREDVARADIYGWANDILESLCGLSGEAPEEVAAAHAVHVYAGA